MTFEKAKAVAAGAQHSLILGTDGQVYASGNNQNGNLGLGHTYSSDSFLMVHGLQGFKFDAIACNRHSAAITDDCRLFVWGPVFMNESPLLLPQELKSNKLIKSISIGENTTAIVDEDAHVYTWGTNNNYGQLGRRDEDQKLVD